MRARCEGETGDGDEDDPHERELYPSHQVATDTIKLVALKSPWISIPG